MKKISLVYQCERCRKNHTNKFLARDCYDSHSRQLPPPKGDGLVRV